MDQARIVTAIGQFYQQGVCIVIQGSVQIWCEKDGTPTNNPRRIDHIAELVMRQTFHNCSQRATRDPVIHCNLSQHPELLFSGTLFAALRNAGYTACTCRLSEKKLDRLCWW